jgi:hypothetical protein
LHSTAKAELFIVPPSSLQKFLTKKLGDSELAPKEMENQLGSQRGAYDLLNDRDRWQVMSKELAQKQELIHQIISQTLDANKVARDKTSEITQLRNAIVTI